MTDTSIEDADKALASMAKRGGRAVKVLLAGLVIIVIVLGGAVGYLFNQNHGETQRIDTAVNQAIANEEAKNKKLCGFFSVLAPIPPPASSGKLTAELLIDSATAYYGLSCSPNLPPPSSGLISLAHKYDLTLLQGK